ncbi:PstA family ABC transporter permease [Mucilaginibacter sp. OK098]|uniref:PstA family ABC transporter permease n=1 Tax=Mucilaginibacter sp. OK098 TaxID=1855297 RepID=UPI00091D3DE1|nr:ABC transporter permease subunit [Mucilaginibacter sp. OK098]SHM09213.1 phosphate transport system permease protein [Mucilaginibacter sp. OK098]
MKKRKFEELFFRILMVLATILVAGSFFLIVGTVFFKGFHYMNLDMITKTPGGGFYIGKEGGVLNAIVGSFYVAGGATILGLLVSIPVAIFINLYMDGKRFLSNTIRMAFDVLFGIPSIVYGAFGFLIMVYFGIRASLLGGIIAVTLLVIPILVRTLDEVIRTVPFELRDAALSLGSTRWETAKVVLRQIRPGIFTAILLSFGRAIGDVASVLFTAGFSDNVPTSLHEPAATLPLAIFFQLGSPVEEVQGRGYASALILTIIVLTITILSDILIKKFSKHKI